MDKTDLTDITFIISIRIDSDERLNNLDYVIWYLQHNFDTNIILTENDKESYLKGRYTLIDYVFQQNNEALFHRTKIHNEMTKRAKTKYIAVYDADVVLPIISYIKSYELLQTDTIDVIYPYNRKCIDVPNSYTKQTENIDFNNLMGTIMLNNFSCGGAFFINKEKYVEAGLENENFVSWGYEDNERLKRFEILELKIKFYELPLYHFYHPRGENSNYHKLYWVQQSDEYKKVSAMSKEELLVYINSWHEFRYSS